MSPLVRALKAERERRGWSQAYVASKLGCTRAQICEWENGRHTPTIITVVRWAAVFGWQLEFVCPATNAPSEVAA